MKKFMRTFIAFGVEDIARSQLLFRRTIPGFEPSAESYAYAEKVLSRAYDVLRAAGVTDEGDLDCFVAMVGGLMEAQTSNDPSGDRWTRHLDRLVDLYLDAAQRSTR